METILKKEQKQEAKQMDKKEDEEKRQNRLKKGADTVLTKEQCVKHLKRLANINFSKSKITIGKRYIEVDAFPIGSRGNRCERNETNE